MGDYLIFLAAIVFVAPMVLIIIFGAIAAHKKSGEKPTQYAYYNKK